LAQPLLLSRRRRRNALTGKENLGVTGEFDKSEIIPII